MREKKNPANVRSTSRVENQDNGYPPFQFNYNTSSQEKRIRNFDYLKRHLDFSGMPIACTDLDGGVIEYRNKGFILTETKYKDAQMPQGQHLALTRMVDAFTKAGKLGVLFVTSHDQPTGDIVIADTVVTQYYSGYHWHKPKREGSTLAEGIQYFIGKMDREGSF